MVFDGRFKDHILPDKIHMLNVSFLVPQLRREFGGCAGNIAYNLRLLGDAGYPMATVGRDFAPYAQWMRETHVPQDYVRIVDNRAHRAGLHHHRSGRQPDHGLPSRRHAALAPECHSGDAGITLGIVAPDGRDGMLQHCAGFAAAGIPFIFDPGQGLPMFNGDDLRGLIARRRWLTVNDYEWQMVQQRTGWSPADVVRACQGPDRDPGGGRLDHLYRRGRDRHPCGQSRPRWWIRPAAAMPIAPA